MINFVEEYMSPSEDFAIENGFDEQRITSRAISRVLPIIIENELTPRQKACLKMFYVNGKSQYVKGKGWQ